jgi:hypothetical protein
MPAKPLSSRKAPQDAAGEPVDLFAYPHGDHAAAVRDRVIAAGYRAAVTCRRGAAQAAPNPYEIPRQDISHGDSPAGRFCKLTFKNRLKERHG